MSNKRGLSKEIIIGIVVGVILIFGIGILYFALKDNVVIASLKVNSGEVMVDRGDGYNQVTGEVTLAQGAKIKTGEDGKATLVLYESLVQLIQPNTEISLDKLSKTNPQISLNSGKAWTKFTGLTGMQNFEIETPNSVAIVRGTGYTTETDSVKVIDGVVEVKTTDGAVYKTEANKVVVLENGTWVERDLTPEEKEELTEYLKESVVVLKEIRRSIIDRNPFVVDLAKKVTGRNTEELQEDLDAMDNGEKDVDETFNKSPVKNDIITRIADITKAIQKENELIGSLN